MDVQKHLDNAIERYGSGVSAQVALSSATVILGVIFPRQPLYRPGYRLAGIAARASRIQQERIDEARAGVADELEHLDQDKVDAKYVESDGFLDWLREAFDQIRRAEDTAKLDALKNVFVNGLIVGQSTGPLRDIILRRVGDLSSHHIRAIQACSKVARPLASDDNPVFTSLSAANAARPFARVEEFRQELGDFNRS